MEQFSGDCPFKRYFYAPGIMNKVIILAAVCAFVPLAAFAETDVITDVLDNVWLGQVIYDSVGADAFEFINGNDIFQPFLFVFETDTMISVASSDYPQLVGSVAFDFPSGGYTHDTFVERLNSCEGLWFYNEFSPDEDTTLHEVLYISDLDEYSFASGFFLPDLNLPDWLDELHLTWVNAMVTQLNETVHCD